MLFSFLNRIPIAAFGLVVSALVLSQVAYAEHPVDVERFTAQSEYFEALTAFQKIPQRVLTNSSRIAAARSAWALGMPDIAIQEFDKALRDEHLSEVERARILLSRGIIEYQEGRYQVALLFSERVIQSLPQSGPLRSRGWLLWGESLYKLTSFGAAEDKYQKALAESQPEDMPEVQFLLGRCRVQLGKLEDARLNFESIPMQHERTPEAIRALAQIALDTGKYTSASIWLTRGREQYPDKFLDSWVDYAQMKIAVQQNDAKKVQELETSAATRFAPSDPWINLLNAEAASYLWKSAKVEVAQ